MLSIPKRILAVLAGLALAGLGLWAGYFWDLDIDLFLYQPNSPIAFFADVFGWWPLYLPVFLYGFVSAVIGRKKLQKQQQGGFLFDIGLAVMLAGLVALILPACDYMRKQKLPYTDGIWPFLYLGIAAICGVAAVFLCRIQPGNLVRLRAFSLLGILYLAINVSLVNVGKMIWQRTRFADMLAENNFDAYTNWLTIPGHGGNSFPSGHTISASAVLLFVFFVLLFPSCKKEAEKFLFTGYVYTLFVGYGRMLMGRHFLSDVIAAALIGTIVLILLWCLPFIRNWMKKTAKQAALLDQAVEAPDVNQFHQRIYHPNKKGGDNHRAGGEKKPDSPQR